MTGDTRSPLRRKSRHTPGTKVVFRGIDVSARCQAYDTRRRRVYLMDVTRHGDLVMTADYEVSGRWHYGHVRVYRHQPYVQQRSYRQLRRLLPGETPHAR